MSVNGPLVDHFFVRFSSQRDRFGNACRTPGQVRRTRRESFLKPRTNQVAVGPVALGSLLLRFAWLLLLLAPAPAAAVDPERHISQYAHTAWRVQDVAEDFRGPFTQTADGYFWFGTASGLVRFDGISFVPYAPSGLKLPTRGFRHLLGARDGSLWIGTTSGLARLKDGKLQWYSDPAQHIGICQHLRGSRRHDLGHSLSCSCDEGPLCRVEGSGLHCYGRATEFPSTMGLA